MLAKILSYFIVALQIIIFVVDDNEIDGVEDAKLQQMISKYQSQVIQQQQLSNRTNHELIK